MGRYVVRYIGRGVAPDTDQATIRNRPGVKVLDESRGMLLVQASAETADELAKVLPKWIVTLEQTFPLPDARPRVRSSPKE